MLKKPLWGRSTMVHELWPHRILTIDRLPSGSRIPSLRQPLRWRSLSAGVLVLGSVSDDGFRSADLPRKLAGHRSMSSFAARQTLPHGVPQPSHSDSDQTNSAKELL